MELLASLESSRSSADRFLPFGGVTSYGGSDSGHPRDFQVSWLQFQPMLTFAAKPVFPESKRLCWNKKRKKYKDNKQIRFKKTIPNVERTKSPQSFHLMTLPFSVKHIRYSNSDCCFLFPLNCARQTSVLVCLFDCLCFVKFFSSPIHVKKYENQI